MDKYYVNRNAQDNGEHEVHLENCRYLPKEENRIYLGFYANCRDAVIKARDFYRQINGCYHCSRECHTS